MSERFQVTHLDELPPQRGADEARWFRLRRDLDVGAFGVNAYGADAGKRVIEEHDELGTAAGKHEELYVVVSGRATFIVDPDNIIQHVTVNGLNVGRNPQETLRILDALQTDELCPCNWTQGEEVLRPAA